MNWLSQNITWLFLSGAAVVALIAWQRFMSRRNTQNGEIHTTQEYSPTGQDPVTGKKVDVAHAITANFEGRTYFFESEASRTVFQQDPARFLHRQHRHHGCC